MKKLFLTAAGDIGIAIKQEFQQYDHFITALTRQKLDLASLADISAYFRDNAKEYNTFVYCAGINDPELIENLPIETVQKTLQVNLLAFYAILQYLILFFKEKGRYIITISSLIWHDCQVRKSCNACFEWISSSCYRIREVRSENKYCISRICGYKKTRKNNNPEKIGSLERKIALGSLSQPSDITDIVYYLCSDQNNYITGQDIVIDGGLMAGSFQ